MSLKSLSYLYSLWHKSSLYITVYETIQMYGHHDLNDTLAGPDPGLSPGVTFSAEVGSLRLVGPRCTCLALVPNPRHWEVSVIYLWAGDTHSRTNSLASPPITHKNNA